MHRTSIAIFPKPNANGCAGNKATIGTLPSQERPRYTPPQVTYTPSGDTLPKETLAPTNAWLCYDTVHP